MNTKEKTTIVVALIFITVSFLGLILNSNQNSDLFINFFKVICVFVFFLSPIVLGKSIDKIIKNNRTLKIHREVMQPGDKVCFFNFKGEIVSGEVIEINDGMVKVTTEMKKTDLYPNIA